MLSKISIAKKLTVPAAEAWQAIEGFGRLDLWFQGITTCRVEGTGVGAHRYMTTADGGKITDLVLEIDATRRQLRYQRLESPFPVTAYQGTVEIFESFDAAAVVVWTVDFESRSEVSAAVAKALIAGIGVGIDGMQDDLAARAATANT